MNTVPLETTTHTQVSSKQLQMMRHALGLDWKKRPYRNRFYTAIHDSDGIAWQDLVQRGLAVQLPGWKSEVDMAYFKCTYEGAKLAYGKPLSEVRFKGL